MTFKKGQIVKGVVCGRFVVVKCEVNEKIGTEVVTVNEIGPQGQVSTKKMRFPVSILVAE